MGREGRGARRIRDELGGTPLDSHPPFLLFLGYIWALRPQERSISQRKYPPWRMTGRKSETVGVAGRTFRNSEGGSVIGEPASMLHRLCGVLGRNTSLPRHQNQRSSQWGYSLPPQAADTASTKHEIAWEKWQLLLLRKCGEPAGKLPKGTSITCPSTTQLFTQKPIERREGKRRG